MADGPSDDYSGVSMTHVTSQKPVFGWQTVRQMITRGKALLTLHLKSQCLEEVSEETAECEVEAQEDGCFFGRKATVWRTRIFSKICVTPVTSALLPDSGLDCRCAI